MKFRHLLAAALAGASLAPLSVAAQDAPPAVDVTAERAAFDRLVTDSYAADEPGVAVVVTRGGDVIYTGARGVANGESGAPLTDGSVFRYASITKQFAAATLLQMVDDGLLSLDDPVSKFLPDYPGDGAAVTVRQLLNHTSGIKSYTNLPGWMAETDTAQPLTNEELVAIFSAEPMEFAPGSAWNYNNSAYYLVGVIIEQVSGRPWYEEMERRIAAPLGLSTLGFRTDEAATPAFATGYTFDGENRFAASKPIHPSVPGAAGALSGTVLDLAKWASALHGGKVLGAETYAAMTAPTVLTDGEEIPYGYGLGLSDLRGRPAIGHSGGIFGFSTDSIYLPDEDVFVAVLANSDSPAVGAGTTMRRLAAIAIGDPYESFATVDADIAALAPYFGSYAIANGGGARLFFERDGQLYTQREGASETQVYAAGGNRFHYGPNSLTWFEMAMSDDGVPVMRMHQNGETAAEIATRTGDVPEPEVAEVPAAVLESYVGNYESAIGVLVVAMGEDGRLTGKLGPQNALPLTPSSETEFAVQGVDATVTFQREEGAVTGLVIRQGGQELPFVRQAGE